MVEDGALSSSTSPATDSALLAVFFEGTANSLRPTTTQVGVFFEACNHYDITEPGAVLSPHMAAFKMGYDGCGVAYGLPGTIWAVGLLTQCTAVVKRVKQLLEVRKHVSVVVFGLSRGGIAALMLAKQLADYDVDRLSVQMCVFDPVPGNLVCITRYLDVFALNAASYVMDCSACRTLRRVLALYPHGPLPDLAFHAPILPIYPSSDLCDVEEDAVLGCHQVGKSSFLWSWIGGEAKSTGEG